MYYYFDFFIIISLDIFTLLRGAQWKDDEQWTQEATHCNIYWDVREEGLTMKVVQYQHSLPGEAVEPLSLEIYRIGLDMALSNLLVNRVELQSQSRLDQGLDHMTFRDLVQPKLFCDPLCFCVNASLMVAVPLFNFAIFDRFSTRVFSSLSGILTLWGNTRNHLGLWVSLWGQTPAFQCCNISITDWYQT